MKQEEACEYCDRDEQRRKKYGAGYDKAWVNVEHKSLDVSVYDHCGIIYITHCPWCGREL